MAMCPNCYQSVPDGSMNCPGCLSRLVEIPPVVEIRHIDYLLGELAIWPARKLVSSEDAHSIYAEYIRRRADLLERAEAAVRPAPKTVYMAPHLRARLGNVPPPAVSPPAKQLVFPAFEPQTPWFGEFLEAHWLKLLAALAALMIFAGMRQLLGWEWVSRLAVALVPVLPIGLTAMFYYFGIRVRGQAGGSPGERPIGGFAYCGVAIVLAAFSVFSINKHWLSGMLPPSESHFAGVIASTAMARWTLYKTRDAGFLHLLLGGMVGVLYTGLQVAIPWDVTASSRSLEYGIAFNTLAFVFLVAGRIYKGMLRGSEVDSVVRTFRIWTHLCVIAVLGRALLPVLAGAALPRETAGMFFAASLLAVLSAQWFSSAGAAYSAGGLAAAGATILLHENLYTQWYAYGFSAVLLSVLALGFSIANGSSETAGQGENEIADAYNHLSLWFASTAGAVILARTVAWLGESAAPITGSDWAQGVSLAGICAILYAVFAVRLKQPELLYASCGAAAFSITLTANRFLTVANLLHYHTFAHDLFPFAALALVSAISLRTWDGKPDDENALLWSMPVTHAAVAAAVVGLAVCIGDSTLHGVSAGLWVGLAAYGLLGILGTGAWLNAAPKWVGQALFTVALCAGGSAAGFAATTLKLGAPWSPELAASYTIAISAWLTLGLTMALPGRQGIETLAPVIKWFSLVTACCSLILAATGVDAALLHMCLPFAASFLLLAVLSQSESGANLSAVSFMCLLVCGLRFAMAALNGGYFVQLAGLLTVTSMLFGAGVYGLLAWKSSGETGRSLSFLCISLAGIGGWALGGRASFLEYITVGEAVVGLIVGSAAALMTGVTSESANFGFLSACFFTAAWMETAVRILGIETHWLSAAALPGLIILYSIGLLVASKKAAITGKTLCDAATGLSVFGAAAVIICGADHPVKYSWIVTGTLIAYSGTYLAGTILNRTPLWSGLCSTTLSVAIGYRLATINLSETRWAMWIALMGAAWLIAARLLEQREVIAPLSPPVYALSGFASLIAAVAAVMYVNEPHQGMFAIIALAIVGSTYAGHFALGKGDAFAHFGFASYFTAYSLYLYDKIHLNSNVLDLYLIPAAIYLLVCGHIASKRGSQDAAAALWWIGLLAALSPTYVAFYDNYVSHGIPLHTALLLIECLGSIAWGIARRVKAFVFCGTLFALAFVVTLLGGLVVEIWSGLFAVTLGVMLLSFVFYVSIHHEALLRWMGKVGDGWRMWR